MLQITVTNTLNNNNAIKVQIIIKEKQFSRTNILTWNRSIPLGKFFFFFFKNINIMPVWPCAKMEKKLSKDGIFHVKRYSWIAPSFDNLPFINVRKAICIGPTSIPDLQQVSSSYTSYHNRISNWCKHH